MDALQPYLARLGDEWERLTSAAAVLLLLVVLATAGRNLLELLQSVPPSQGSIPKTPAFFAATAFQFLDRDAPQVTLGADHCFSVKPPRGWRPPAGGTGPQETVVTNITRTPPERVVITPPPRDPTPRPTPTPNSTPTPPKPKDFLTYKGSMTAPSGQPLAYLEREHDPGGGQAKQRQVAFLAPGSELLGYKIVRFDAEQLELTDADGKSRTLPTGQRQRLPQRD